jgi:lauroyl/myristoyl acyltransferase
VRFINAIDLYLLCVVSLIQMGKCLSFLGLRWLLVQTVGFMAYHFSRTKRRLSEQNLSQTCQGKLSKERLRKIVKSSFYQFWLEALSIPPSRMPAVAFNQLNIRGLEYLRSAMNNKKGAILWESSHFGRRLLAKQILHRNGFVVYQVHGEYHMGGFGYERGFTSWTRQHLIRPFFENCERAFVKGIIYFTGVDSLAFTKVLAQRLSQNDIICISGDAGHGHKRIALPFLGRKRFFPTGMVSLAKFSGAPILPLFCVQENGNRTRLVIEPPLRIEIEGDREHNLEKTLKEYASLLESYVERYPEQYRNWQHLGGFDSWQPSGYVEMTVKACVEE